MLIILDADGMLIPPANVGSTIQPDAIFPTLPHDTTTDRSQFEQINGDALSCSEPF